MIYQLYTIGLNQINPNAAMTVNQTPSKSFLFDINNPDYQTFKSDLANGATLQDATGTPMTASEITTFLQGLK